MSEIQDLRKAVAGLLPEGTVFSDSDDLVSLGLDSLRIMKVVNQLRKQRVKVSFAKFISEPTIDSWMRLVKAADRGSAGQQKKTANLNNLPMTEIQKAYFAGRQEGQALGDVGCHAYIEFDSREGKTLTPQAVQEGWKNLLETHPMLRASFSDQGLFSILPHSPLETVAIYDFTGLDDQTLEKELLTLRGQLSHRKMHVEKGEVAGLSMCLLPKGRVRLLFDADMIAIDLSSLCQTLGDLAKACQGKELEKEGDGFAGWLLNEGADSPEDYERARAYWTQRIESMPGAPEISLAVQPEAVKQTRIVRRRHHVAKEAKAALDRCARAYGLTPAVVLLTAYAETLATFATGSSSSHFLLNLPLADRRGAQASVVGEFTKVEILEINLTLGRTFIDHARSIQEQLYRDMDHNAFTGVSVLRELGRSRGINAPFVFAGGVEAKLLQEHPMPRRRRCGTPNNETQLLNPQ